MTIKTAFVNYIIKFFSRISIFFSVSYRPFIESRKEIALLTEYKLVLIMGIEEHDLLVSIGILCAKIKFLCSGYLAACHLSTPN